MVLNKYYGDTGFDQLDTGGNPIFTFLSSVLNDGEVLADDGRAYSSVQTAENNASGFILIGPGTFNESVTVDTADFQIVGSGRDTVIDGGSSDGIAPQSVSDVSIKNLAATSNSGGSISYDNCSNLIISEVFCPQTDDGIRSNANGSSDVIVSNCNIDTDATDGAAIIYPLRSITTNCIIDATGTSGNHDAIAEIGTTDDSIISNTIIDSAARNGVRTDRNDTIFYGNRIINPGSDGIETRGTDTVISKNRISDATTGIDDQGTNTLQDDNEIDSAN